MKKRMRNKLFYICLFICILFITGLAGGEEGDERDEMMPNPAAVYAASMGYKHKIRDGKGVVIFPDRTEADEWDFFRGKAGQQWSYCEQHGGKIENRVEDMGSWSAEYAVCVFVDGSECKEIDYFDGSCGPGIWGVR
ncbi:MAG: DUF333 domain-containing protein [Candidatus Omnitrophota bacterium]